MNAIEYALMRRVHVLEETSRRRQLTDEELEFKRKVAPLLRRLAEEERKRVPRSGA